MKGVLRILTFVVAVVIVASGCSDRSSPKVATNEFGDFTVSIDSVTPQKKRGVAGYAINYTITFTGTRSAISYEVPWLQDSHEGLGLGVDFLNDSEQLHPGDTTTKYLFTPVDLSQGEHTFYVVGPDDGIRVSETKGTIEIGPEDIR